MPRGKVNNPRGLNQYTGRARKALKKFFRGKTTTRVRNRDGTIGRRTR